MKKALVAVTLSSLFALSASAQNKKAMSTTSGPYVRVGVGYAFPHAGNTNGDKTIVSGVTSYNNRKYSYGAGVNSSLGFGYWFNNNFGLELAANIGVAPKKFESELTYSDPGKVYTATLTATDYAKVPVYLMPSAMIKTGGDQFYVYARMGLAINVAGKSITEIDFDNGPYRTYQKEEFEYHTGAGFQAALGVSVIASENVSLFAEVNGISMNQYLRKSEITEFTDNGVDRLYSLKVAERQTEYEMEYTEVPNPSNTNPTTEVSYARPFSNIGLSVGISIRFK